jgi:hypothetical protein
LPTCAAALGFEVRLTGDGPVDLGISVTPHTAGAIAPAGLAAPALSSMKHDAVWGRLSALARAWLAPDSALGARVPFLFLEFDLEAPGGAVPCPSVFMAVDWQPHELSADGGQLAERGLTDLLNAASMLRSARLELNVVARVKRVFQALPRGAVLIHIGVMLAREGESLRLSTIVPLFNLGAFLSEIEQSPLAAAAVSAVERFGPWSGLDQPGSHVQLDFDPTGADPRLGIALCPPGQDGWPTLLAHLCREGLCRSAKAESLLQWQGQSVANIGGAALRTRRYLEHVKLVVSPARSHHAKAYFGLTPVTDRTGPS